MIGQPLHAKFGLLLDQVAAWQQPPRLFEAHHAHAVPRMPPAQREYVRHDQGAVQWHALPAQSHPAMFGHDRRYSKPSRHGPG